MNDNLNKNIRNNFAKLVDSYAKYRRDYPEKSYKLIYNFCPSVEAIVLDIGCGTGIVTKHLSSYYKNITGTDREIAMTDFAKDDNKNLKFISAKAEELPFENESFDLVTVATAYHWFDFDLAGKEIFRVLKPSGKMCVFWRMDISKSRNYLPQFAYDNLIKLISIIPKASREPITEEIFTRVGFSNVKKEEFAFEDTYTKEEILGYVQSHSTFNLLDDKQKEEYIRLNEEAVDQYLVDGIFTFEQLVRMFFIEK
jgi:ubiquinone/menaquinone biosynthesis C-methylase UbiE